MVVLKYENFCLAVQSAAVVRNGYVLHFEISFVFWVKEREKESAEKLKQRGPFQNSNIFISLDLLNLVRLKEIFRDLLPTVFSLFFTLCMA